MEKNFEIEEQNEEIDEEYDPDECSQELEEDFQEEIFFYPQEKITKIELKNLTKMNIEIGERIGKGIMPSIYICENKKLNFMNNCEYEQEFLKHKKMDPMDPFEFFADLISDDIIELGTKLTNDFHTSCLEICNTPITNKKPKNIMDSHHKKLKDITPSSLKTYLGILLMMGLVRKPNLEDYGVDDTILLIPGFRNLLSLDEFKMIDRFFQIRYGFYYILFIHYSFNM